ncbi:GNAT family N-acetyltransferase [Acuticoccus mangrovi]
MDLDLAAALRSRRVLVASDAASEGGGVVGVIVFDLEGEAPALIDTVAVAPDRQGRGIGPRLIEAAETEIRAAGAGRVTLYTNVKMAANLALYPRLGYRETGRVTGDGFRRVNFEKTLAPRIALKAPVDGLYGRRRVHGHTIDPTYDRYALDLEAPAAPLVRHFEVPVGAVRLEVGFGGGEHLVHHARSAPDVGLIGVEPFESGMMRAVRDVAAEGLANVRLYLGDARRVLEWLPDGALDRVDILYPDPWHKKKHWKRRFVSVDGLDRLARVLAPGGVVRFASDIPSYVAWTRAHAAAHPAFAMGEDSATPWEGWPGTRYEAKAFREGRTPRYLTLVRA